MAANDSRVSRMISNFGMGFPSIIQSFGISALREILVYPSKFPNDISNQLEKRANGCEDFDSRLSRGNAVWQHCAKRTW
jgi:hypothetical protein